MTEKWRFGCIFGASESCWRGWLAGMLCVCSGDAAAGKWMLRRRCRNGDAHVTGYDLRKVVVFEVVEEWLLIGCEEEKEGGGFWRRCYR